MSIYGGRAFLEQVIRPATTAVQEGSAKPQLARDRPQRVVRARAAAQLHCGAL